MLPVLTTLPPLAVIMFRVLPELMALAPPTTPDFSESASSLRTSRFRFSIFFICMVFPGLFRRGQGCRIAAAESGC